MTCRVNECDTYLCWRLARKWCMTHSKFKCSYAKRPNICPVITLSLRKSTYKYGTSPIKIISRFDKSRYIDFVIHLNIRYRYVAKNYASRFVKTTYNLEQRE